MSHIAQEVQNLLSLLDEYTAEELESEMLDFKECTTEEKLKELARDMAVCLGNAAGGTVVFGVKDGVVGRNNAVVGINFAPDLSAVRSYLFNSIDPKLPVEFEWLVDGPHRLLLMHIVSYEPPYTTTSGRGSVRVGKDCMPLVGSLRRRIEEGAGRADLTRNEIRLRDPIDGLSPGALELLRREMRALGVPDDVINLPDRELCSTLGIIRNGKLTFGGLLVAGREDVIAEHVPNHEWKYGRMRSDVDYESVPAGGHESIVVALDRLQLLIGQANPITTVQSGFFHAEFPQYPVIALREALLNAFAHRDYSIPSFVLIRHWRERVEMSSPGGFVADVTPRNILHHAPVTRNRYLVETILLATRLVNRINLGVPRMFRALLQEGKEPPVFDEIGQSVRVTFLGQDVDRGFQALLRILEEHGARLDVDTMLLLHFFRRRHEAQWAEIEEAYPYNERLLREKLAYMEHTFRVIERSGSGRGTVYRLSRSAAAICDEGATYDLTRRLDKEAIKVRILTLIKDRPLSNKDIREFTDLTRKQVFTLLRELEEERQVHLRGRGNKALWHAGEKQR